MQNEQPKIDKFATLSNVWQEILGRHSKKSPEKRRRLIEQGVYLNHSSVRPVPAQAVKEHCGQALSLYRDTYRRTVRESFRKVETELAEKNSLFARALGFLDTIALYDSYVQFCGEHRFSADFGAARAYYNVWNVFHLLKHLELVRAGESLRVLEIGAGAGMFGLFLSKLVPKIDYTIVDLPQMLEFSRYNLELLAPQTKFRFLSPGELADVPEASFDCTVNFNSFMEMDRDTVAHYFDQIYRTSRCGALHFNINRVQPNLVESSGMKFLNNPLLYPYRHDDAVIFWDTDPFQVFTRFSYGGLTESQAYTRAAVLGGSPGSSRELPVSYFHPSRNDKSGKSGF